ncbi:MAG: Crp/Fnr family transcriptional regulator [Methylobacterium sp.]|uniref:Crp/Fnr family transcriptional regulator n=1 Tax=Methylobacterium sp. TaxID=409 RepID=UPI0025894C8A|nr:Crp/Fnr family transcriptional regulator [Methylobacterium sp.]MBY0295626.1 Crp/Fnr family transcriptional regulator [Methylobacterium sp.]
MTNAFVRKLQRGVELSESDQQQLLEATSRTQIVNPYTILVREGAPQDGAYILLSGFAYCFKLLANGERQIVACHVAGDADGLYGIANESADYTTTTLTTCTVAFITRNTINKLMHGSPNISRAFWWCLLREKAYVCAWLANIGQRPAPQRLAYFICDMLFRQQAVGLARNGSFEIPFTQQDFGDILGITNVHACRIFAQLRNLGLIYCDQKTISVKDLDRLVCYADFSPVLC